MDIFGWFAYHGGKTTNRLGQSASFISIIDWPQSIGFLHILWFEFARSLVHILPPQNLPQKIQQNSQHFSHKSDAEATGSFFGSPELSPRQNHGGKS